VAQDVHDPRVTAAGQHDQAASAHVRDQRLVVEDQRVRLPAPVPVRLVRRHSVFELGRAVDLAGHQERAVEQERRLLALDHVEAGSVESAPARGRQLDRLAAGERHPAAAPELGMEDDGQVGSAQFGREPVHSRGVVPVPVAEHDDVDVVPGELETAHVLDQAVRCDPGVEQDPRGPLGLRDRDEAGESMLGSQDVARCRKRERCPLGRSRVDEQGVGHVVDQRGDRHRVYGLECDGLHRSLQRLGVLLRRLALRGLLHRLEVERPG
jgi:hypothetical protein